MADHHILGFGPAAVGFFVAADRLGRLQDLLREGVVVHEAQGDLHSLLRTGITYDIPSNSYARDFIEGIAPDGVFATIHDSPLVQMFRNLDRDPVPLTMVATLIHAMRQVIVRILSEQANCGVRFGDETEQITCRKDWVRLKNRAGHVDQARTAIVATGSAPVIPTHQRIAAYANLLPLLHAEELLRPGGLKQLPKAARQFVVIGGSHSAFSVANKIATGALIDNLRITIVHREPIRRMFLSQDDARLAGERFDPLHDVCPTSGREFRFQGLYTRSKDLFEQISAGQHKAISLHKLAHNEAFEDVLADADTAIACTGYAPRLPIIHHNDGCALEVGQNGGAVWVNHEGRLCDNDGQPLMRLYALGLGFGRKQDAFGEPSYKGAPVGLNFFQGPDGAAICRHIQQLTRRSFAPVGKEVV